MSQVEVNRLDEAVEALIADPITRTMMAADRISADEMRDLLRTAWIATQSRALTNLDSAFVGPAP